VRLLTSAVLAAALLAVSGCGEGATAGAGGGKILVVAAENTWGSIARALGGDEVAVSSIVVNPDTDPHAYDPTAADAIAVARSGMAIVNGIGYDMWASRLLAANPSSSRVVLNVGDLLGLRQGANPHQWYSPASVRRVIAQITAAYARIDPRHRLYFERRRLHFETRALAEYDHLRSEIRSRYAGVPVGYSESIFEPLGADLGLRLMTPPSFAKAIAEGTDVSAADTQTVATQAQRHEIAVWVYNSQNATPDVQRANELARAAGIPITTITETLDPASASFQQWQVSELEHLLGALHSATGR
jgi:zinc/manganese transport system substrate-binding protein